MSNILSKETNRPLKVGVTGGIGSGKSLVCSIFKVLQVPVFEADLEAKILMNSNPEIRQELIVLLGENVYTGQGTLDTKRMAEIIFNDKEIIQKVNQIIHPVVRNKFIAWGQEQNSDYIIQEAAILFESGAYQLMDFNILITAPEELRIKRVMERDRTTKQKVLDRMDNQWNDEKKIKLADFIIYNDESNFLVTQVLEIHKKILEYGKVC
jgi:dephospho-CoA kinase